MANGTINVSQIDVLTKSGTGTVSIVPPNTNTNRTLTLPDQTATLATLTTPSFGTTIGVGGATAAASGAGISFPATQSASSDANTLDDYEEGTFTPSLGGNATYSTRNGNYVKIGQFVFFRFTLAVTTLGTGSTTTISGFPFTSLDTSSGGNYRGAVGYFASSAVSTINLLWNIGSNGTTMDFTTVASSVTTSNGSGAIFQNGAHVQVTGVYITS